MGTEVMAVPANGASLEMQRFMPVMGMEQALQRRDVIVQATKRLMQDGVDYGTIPGTGNRPALLQPGADKLCNLFGLVIKYEFLEKTEDWDGAQHNGEPFFYYQVHATAWRGEFLMGEGIGACSSWESKYRWRKSERKCPRCGKENIRKSKNEGGWYCWQKTGGCGATFKDGDKSIEGQEVGRAPNPDIADQVNTIIKMAVKRCLGGSAPIMFRVRDKVTRSDMEGLFLSWQKATHPIQVPGIDGSWRTVMQMVREDNREVFRISLADGSTIPATAEHRFPTDRGLLHVSELKVGDSLLRSRICLRDGKADLRAAWLVGLFLAEGSFGDDGTTIRFTLHSEEQDFVTRIREYADSLGCTTTITQKVGNSMAITVSGPAFTGVMRTFVDGKGSDGKSISRRAWRQGPRFLDEVLDGYLAGDGHQSARPMQNDRWMLGFTGKNRNLAEDLRAVSAVLGYRCRLDKTKAKIKEAEYPAYRGWISREAAAYNERNLDQITAIEKADRLLTVYDMEVDGDHLFCLANGIQTHNSKVAATINAVSASEFFTQDLEPEDHPAEPSQGPRAQSVAASAKPAPAEEAKPVPSTLDQIVATLTSKSAIASSFEQLKKHYVGHGGDLNVWDGVMADHKINEEQQVYPSYGAAKKAFKALWAATQTLLEALPREEEPVA